MPELPVPGRGYFIVPACAPDMSVAIGDRVVLQLMSRRLPSQKWFMREFDSFGTGRNVAFYTPPLMTEHYGIQHNALAYTGYHNQIVVTQDPSDRHCWNLRPVGDFFCIQNYSNNDQNLNAAGNGPWPEGTLIYAYDWSGGASNEIWKFVPFD